MRTFARASHHEGRSESAILVLRGSQGGLLGMIGGLTGLLETNAMSMGTMQMRNGRIPLFVFPQLARILVRW